MNTPSPAPKRRRHTQAEEDAALKQAELDTIHLSPRNRAAAAPVSGQMDIPGSGSARRAKPKADAHRVRRKKARVRTYVDSALEDSIFERIPGPLRFMLIVFCISVFTVSAAVVTRHCLDVLEERRRLEAEATERAQHPLRYADLIVEYALGQGLDPALVSAVILSESSFNPQAESRLGARGLMQLMEDTAAWLAHKLDEDGEGYSFDKMYDPETNIRFGTWYLGYLSRRFGGDATKVVCAYHAGQGNVDAWLSNPEYSSDGVTLDVIPMQNTADYASRVLRARDVYRKYYFPASAPESAGT